AASARGGKHFDRRATRGTIPAGWIWNTGSPHEGGRPLFKAHRETVSLIGPRLSRHATLRQPTPPKSLLITRHPTEPNGVPRSAMQQFLLDGLLSTRAMIHG